MIIRNTTSGLEVEGQGPINDIELPATYDEYTSKLIIGLGVGFVFDYEQDADPGAVGAGKWWADTTVGAERVGRRNAGNDAWVFFSSSQIFVTDNAGVHVDDNLGVEVTL